MAIDCAGKAHPSSTLRRIVMFPFLARGHLVPFLELAKLIRQQYSDRYAVTLVSTPLNVRILRQSLPTGSGVLLREISFGGAEHGLPADVENTDSLPPAEWVRILEASATLRPAFEKLVAEEIPREDGCLPVCIIADFFLGWTVRIAEKLGVFHAVFATCGGFGAAVCFSMWLHLPHLKALSEEFCVPGLPEGFRLRRSQLTPTLIRAGGGDPKSLLIREQIAFCLSSNAILCNTVEGLEPAGTASLRTITGLRVWSVWTTSAGRRAGRNPGVSSEACLRWLDGHPARSVLFVSFGSQNSVSSGQMLALAAGLEATQRPFIWVIRPPAGFDVKGEFREEWLPEGFEERMASSRRGLLVRNWAPQLEILSHASVGGFLSHCGWNSTMESLSKGVPLIGWPLAAEQFYNSKLLEEELGVCVELARGTEQRVLSAEVERVVRQVMTGEKGEEMRRKAESAAETIRAALVEGDKRGSSLTALDAFIANVLESSSTTPSTKSLMRRNNRQCVAQGRMAKVDEKSTSWVI